MLTREPVECDAPRVYIPTKIEIRPRFDTVEQR